MSLEQLIDSYGYSAVLIGTLLEGETILVLGGIAAKLGYLKLPWVIACAFTGTLFGDQLFFFLGRYRGQAFLERRPGWEARAKRVHRIMERHRIPIILGFRFLYGLRTVTPFVIGMSRVPIAEFALLNVIGAAVWAILIGVLGYVFGHGLELILGDLMHYEIEILAAVALMGAVIWTIRIIYTKKREARARD